jgi:PAS domain S-box-containing protein
VLIVEDSEDEALLLVRELKRGGYEPDYERVETPAAMKKALAERGPWDVVISDYRMPRFRSSESLAISRTLGLETPFIVVSSGRIGEELVVQAVKAGAYDYVMKDNLTRLCATVKRGLEEAKERRERIRAENALKESEARFRALVQNSSDLISVLTPDGTRKYVSPSVERILGYEPDELIGGNAADLTHPDDRPVVQKLLAWSAQAPDDELTFEARLHHADGSWRTFEAAATNLLDEPSVGGIVLNARDITERKRTEEKLRRRDAILETVRFAAERFLSEAASWEESIEDVLEQLGQATGASRVYIFENHLGEDGEVWGTQRYEWVAPEVSTQIDNPLLKALPYRNAGFGRWEMELGRGDLVHGHTRDFPESEQPELRAEDILSIVVVPIFVEGEWWGFVGFDECFTEREWSAAEMDALKAAASTLGAAVRRKQVEEALRESEARFGNLTEAAFEGIAITKNGKILETNRAFADMYGYELSEVRGMSALEFQAPETRDEVWQKISSGFGEPYESVGLKKDGTTFDVEIRGRTTWYGDRFVRVTAMRDITKRKQAEKALRESERLYRTVLKQVTENICLVDAESRLIVESNAAFEEVLGYTKEELQNLTLYDFVAHDKDSIDRNIRRALEEGRNLVGQRKYRRKDGSLLDVEVSMSTIVRHGRETLCIVAHDVTERARMQELLEERVATLSHIASNITLDLSMEEMMDALAKSMVNASTAVACVVALSDERTDTLHPVGSHGLPEGSKRGLDASWRAGALSFLPALTTVEAFRTQQPVLVHNVRQFLLTNASYGSIHHLVRGALWDTVYIVPLISRERPLGAINLLYLPEQKPGEDETAFLGAVADQTTMAVENARLFAEVRGKAALEERQRLARELHDSVSQALYGIALGAKTARTLLERDPAQATEPLEYVLSLADAGLAEMRALIFELRPESLEKEGLAAALKKQAAALKARHEIEVEAVLCEEPEASLEVREAIYRIVQEALHNTVKHANASKVRLKMECDTERISLEVSDNGVGFDPQGDFPGHLGLRSMHERASRLAGTLEVDSVPGKGTGIRAQIPVRRADVSLPHT